MKELLIKLDACQDARDWAQDKNWEEIYNTCHRGDWLLWLFKKTNPNDLRQLTLAKGHCANTVRHLMKDPRSIAGVDAAIAFGNSEISEIDLNNATYAVYAAYANVAYAATYAYATYTDAAYTDAAAKTKNQLETANICRKYLPIEIWNIIL